MNWIGHRYLPPLPFTPGMRGTDPVKVEKRPGRNNKCPCGSGKKTKKCCPERTRP
jgi:hypothetical protein